MHISDGVLSPSVLAAGYVAAGGLAVLGCSRMKDSDYPRVGIMTAAFFVASLLHVPVPPTSVHLTLGSLVGISLGVRCFPAIMIALFLQAVLLRHGGITTLGVNTVMMAVPGYLAGVWMRWELRRSSSGWPAFILVLVVVSAVTPKMLSLALVETKLTAGPLPVFAVVLAGLGIAFAFVLLERLVRGGPVFRLGFAAGASAVFGAAAILFCILAFAPLARYSERQAFRDIAYFAFLAHAPIMLVEGAVVAFVVRYLKATAPELLRIESAPQPQA